MSVRFKPNEPYVFVYWASSLIEDNLFDGSPKTPEMSTRGLQKTNVNIGFVYSTDEMESSYMSIE